MKELRGRTIPDKCKECRFNTTCNGGAKCMSYAIEKDFTGSDPLCPIIHYKFNNNLKIRSSK